MHESMEILEQPALSAPLFRCRGLGYQYPNGPQALDHIDLDIAAGDRLALVGQNGSGKTTLIKLLCGLLSPAAGQLLYNGRPLEGDHLERNRLKIGLLFQDPDDQLFGHTLIEDVAFGPRNQGLNAERAETVARQALMKVSLAEKAYQEPHHLSFGQKKRAALAGLLAMQPDVLLLDEPTANLDPNQEQVFLDLLQNFKGTLICISHDLIFLYELCDRAVVLDCGRIQHDYTVRHLVAQPSALRSHGLDFSFRLVVTADSDSAPSTSAPSCAPLAPNPAAQPDLVDLRQFSYRYPDGTLALDGIDLTMVEGERIAMVGENGAGKTTLLACLLGLRQGHGQFHFRGKPVTRGQRHGLWRQVGLVFQDCADQLFCPTVAEEVSFGLHQLGLPDAEIDRRLVQSLERVHLSGFEQRVPLHMSGGERKRLALACVLAMQPRLLILDEPTAGLDPQGEELLLSILKDLEGTLLIVSHDMFFVRELTCRTIVLHQGRILEDMPTHSFLQDRRLGNLNGLAYSFRQRGSDAIRLLQHEHEYLHEHHHVHGHPHAAADQDHPHAHGHVHRHRYFHSHPGQEQPHEHAPRRIHPQEMHDHGDDAEKP
ncbi:MAG: energy-coupling factor transporter ATPase [Desulfobacteraceae bacterium]|nr:energy-coupling factor transporter ATPase [Desulfobacteraceae bacterium]